MTIEDVAVLATGAAALFVGVAFTIRGAKSRRREALLGTEGAPLGVIRPSLADQPTGQTMLVELVRDGVLIGPMAFAPALPSGFDLVPDSGHPAPGGRRLIRVRVPSWWLKPTDEGTDATHGILRFRGSHPAPPIWWRERTKPRGARRRSPLKDGESHAA